MDFYTLALGLFMLCHGSYIALTRAKAKHQKARLDFMKKRAPELMENVTFDFSGGNSRTNLIKLEYQRRK